MVCFVYDQHTALGEAAGLLGYVYGRVSIFSTCTDPVLSAYTKDRPTKVREKRMGMVDFIANRQTCLKWLRMPRLSPAEAAALLLGYDPGQYAKLRNAEAKELARKFRELEQDVTRKFPQIDVRDRSPVRPEWLVNWAIEIEFELPEPLQGSIDKLFGNRQTSAARPGDLDAQLEALKAENARLNEQVARLEKEVFELVNDKIQPKTKTSLQVMVLAMAQEQYGWDPRATRTDVASLIASDAHTQGLGITEQTVRNQLFAAMERKEAGYLPESQA